MRRVAWGLALTVMLGWCGVAHASGDEGCEDLHWALPAGGEGCASRVVIVPGNDSRINLLLLASDKAGQPFSPAAYPMDSWQDSDFGHVFLDWRRLRSALYPPPPRKDGDAWPDDGTTGSRCAGLKRADAEFAAALAATRDVPLAERDALTAARGRLALVCGQQVAAQQPWMHRDDKPVAFPPWPTTISSAAGKVWLAYLQAAEAFYGEKWSEARDGFVALAGAGDRWVNETSRYMLVRVEIGASQAGAIDQYGSYRGLRAIDQAAVVRARNAAQAYRTAWPQGRYRASLDGLERRFDWLAGDFAALDARYARALAQVGPQSQAGLDLIAEIDDKLLFNQDNDHPTSSAPVVQATLDLVAMRGDGERVKADAGDALSGQAVRFAQDGALYAYLRAAEAYWVRRDYRAVLTLIPDDSHRASYLPLAFSAQYLRGMALAKLADRNEAGFWRDLLHGATAPWQGPAVQLALALNLERHGQVAQALDPASPISDADVRAILINHSAGPQVLRQLATGATNPAERNLAASVLLYKLLSREDYAGFLAARAVLPGLPVVPARRDGDPRPPPETPAAYVSGKTSEGYACADLAATVTRLAADRGDPHGLLCLGEFLRLNGLDGVQIPDVAPKHDDLGGVADDFPGQPLGRGPLYMRVIANPRADADARAYAMYRAVMCFAPDGNDGCGGMTLDPAGRKALFFKFKHDYPSSPWARKLRYYW